MGKTAGPLLGQTNAGVTDAFLLKLAGEPPQDSTIVDSSEPTPIPALAANTLEPENAQTPVPVTAAKPGALEASAPAAESPAGGSCGLSAGSKAGAGWLLTVLIAPGLMWVRRKVSNA